MHVSPSLPIRCDGCQLVLRREMSKGKLGRATRKPRLRRICKKNKRHNARQG